MTGTQKKYLRGLAHSLKPVVLVGAQGVGESVHKAVDQALTTHELIKVRLRHPLDKQEQAQTLAGRAGADLCGIIGHTAILYRPHPENPRIFVP